MPKVYFTDDDMCTTLKLEVKRIHDFFIANGWSQAADIEEADLVICPTCVGWAKLEKKSLDYLRSLNKTGKNVVSLGCLNHFNPDDVARVHGGIRVPTQKLEQIETLIPNAKVKLCDIPEPSTFRCKEDYRLYDLTKRYVNIASGCSFSCSYCPHKIGLGPLKSRSAEHILEQVKDLVRGGVRIVVLTGMETSLYGMDIGTNYPSLFQKVLDVDSSFKVHVAQFSPIGIARYYDSLLPLFSNIRVTDIQIPIQTTSNRILKLMYRPLATEKVGSFLKAVKKNNKQAVLRTDIIVGFPTETEEELDDTLRFAADIFDEVAVYACEIRKGLPVEKLAGKAYSSEEVERRIEYAASFLEDKGIMTHKGQQGCVSLVEVERRKEAIRNAKMKGIHD